MLAARPVRPSWTFGTVATLSMLVALIECRASELHVGGATVSITPDRPVALAGQMHTRIARSVESPVTATALALESRDGDKPIDQAILVSCDLVSIDAAVLDINLDGEMVYSVADLLAARGIPFVFVTGYGAESIDGRFAHVPVLQKPVERQMLEGVFVIDAARANGSAPRAHAETRPGEAQAGATPMRTIDSEEQRAQSALT